MKPGWVVVGALLAVLVPACTEPDGAPDPPPTVTGVVTEVDSVGLEVGSFVVRDGDDDYEILIDPDVQYGFPLTHLRDHLRSGDRVTVVLDHRGEKLYATTIEDVETTP